MFCKKNDSFVYYKKLEQELRSIKLDLNTLRAKFNKLDFNSEVIFKETLKKIKQNYLQELNSNNENDILN
jgi:hypothetical protein